MAVQKIYITPFLHVSENMQNRLRIHREWSDFHSDDGFTLLELMVVMGILLAMAMMVTPIFSDSLRGLRQENDARDLFAAMNYAHTRAITESTSYRLYMDLEKQMYWIGKETESDEGIVDFYFLEEHEFEAGVLGDGLVLSKPDARYDRKSKLYYVEFFPSGMCDAVEIVMSREKNPRDTYVIATNGMKIRMETPEG